MPKTKKSAAGKAAGVKKRIVTAAAAKVAGAHAAGRQAPRFDAKAIERRQRAAPPPPAFDNRSMGKGWW